MSNINDISIENYKFPAEPPRPVGKPKPPKKGEKPAPLPENSVWFTHDPAIYHDPVSNNYYVYGTGAECLKSTDLIEFTRLGRVIDAPPQDSSDWVGGKAIWAPDIVKVGDEYRLYGSNSTWGVRQSCIFLATSDNAEGPFIPKGAVLKTSEKLPVNAIDANIIEDVRTGEQYMNYGSFWGGCHIIKLDKETGFAADTNPVDEQGLIGKCIARRPRWADCAIEGPYIIYNPDTDYYYLFVSYASLKSDYNIRVGRSRNVTGPYYDHNGRDMTDLNDTDNTLGYMVECGYAFKDCVPYMGPGHNSVLRDFDNNWYVVCHIREKNFKGGEASTMHIRKIVWTEDGWPCASPLQYAGEQVQDVPEELLYRTFERITLQPTIPQGVRHSTFMELKSDKTVVIQDSITGHWDMKDSHTIEICYGKTVETLTVLPGWDYELWKPCLVLTGVNNNHICVWAKSPME